MPLCATSYPYNGRTRTQFDGAKVFSKLDARSGYWSVKLNPESQLLTTYYTPFGRHCFLRLPFGLNISQDAFQCAMDQNLEGLEGVISIADNIALFGKDETSQAHAEGKGEGYCVQSQQM